MCHNLRHAGRAPPATAFTTPACCNVNTGSQARYRLRIAISAYPTCIRRPRYRGVPVRILPSRFVWKKLEWYVYPTVKKNWRFDTMHEHDRQTDRHTHTPTPTHTHTQTDRHTPHDGIGRPYAYAFARQKLTRKWTKSKPLKMINLSGAVRWSVKAWSPGVYKPVGMMYILIYSAWPYIRWPSVLDSLPTHFYTWCRNNVARKTGLAYM